jgi:excisionase family DNA binding protein
MGLDMDHGDMPRSRRSIDPTPAVGEQPRPKRFYTVPEAAQLLTVSAPTLYREIRAGRFPAIRVRGRYVVPAKALDAMEQAAVAGGIVDPADVSYYRAQK